MTHLIRLLAVIGFASVFSIAHAGEITDTYTTGDTLTATTLDNIKSAVNDNDTRVTANEGDISDNALDISTNTSEISTITGDLLTIATDIMTNSDDIMDLQDIVDSTIADFDSSIRFHIPVLSSTSGNTAVTVWLANESSTTCNVYIDESINAWRIGSNSTGFIILPSYSTLSMPAKVFSFPSTTTTIVSRAAMNANVSTSVYVNVSVFRAESDALDTCDAGDISVRGALATYPGGVQYFIPVKEMVVR